MCVYAHLYVYVCEEPESNDYVHLTQFFSLAPDLSELLVEGRFSDNPDRMQRSACLTCLGVKRRWATEICGID